MAREAGLGELAGDAGHMVGDDRGGRRGARAGARRRSRGSRRRRTPAPRSGSGRSATTSAGPTTSAETPPGRSSSSASYVAFATERKRPRGGAHREVVGRAHAARARARRRGARDAARAREGVRGRRRARRLRLRGDRRAPRSRREARRGEGVLREGLRGAEGPRRGGERRDDPARAHAAARRRRRRAARRSRQAVPRRPDRATARHVECEGPRGGAGGGEPGSARWVLDHKFVELHLVDAATPPQYEAIVLIGYSHADERYVAHWCDTFGGAFSALGRGSARATRSSSSSPTRTARSSRRSPGTRRPAAGRSVWRRWGRTARAPSSPRRRCGGPDPADRASPGEAREVEGVLDVRGPAQAEREPVGRPRPPHDPRVGRELRRVDAAHADVDLPGGVDVQELAPAREERGSLRPEARATLVDARPGAQRPEQGLQELRHGAQPTG